MNTPEPPIPPAAPAPLLMVIAGEESGDMHAAHLIARLKTQLPGLRCFGVGGHALRREGMETLYDTSDMAVMGFVEVLRRFSFFRRVFRHLLREAQARKPDAVLLVDYPGFNLRFAARAHAMGLRTFYYICPQVWAWNRRRIPRMARVLDRLMTIFPFEPAYFRNTPLPVDFVGHPLVQSVERSLAEPESTLPWQGRPRIAILPGSRRHEIGKLLPVMAEAAQKLEQEHPGLSCLIACPTPAIETFTCSLIAALPRRPRNMAVVCGRTRQVLRQADAAWVASGTATVETALVGCPMVIAYRMAWPTYWLARLLVRVPFIGMVNIIAGREICPEFIQHRATADALAQAIRPLLVPGPERTRMTEAFRDIKERLGQHEPEEMASRLIAGDLRSPGSPHATQGRP